MDADRFDALTKTFIAHLTRRATLRVLVGGAIGGPLATAVMGPIGRAADLAAANKNKNKNKNKRKKKKQKEPPCGAPRAQCCGRTRNKKQGTFTGSCIEGASCTPEAGYCKCEGCAVLGGCEPSCRGECCIPALEVCCGVGDAAQCCKSCCGAGATARCCGAGQECCLDPNQNTQSCRSIDNRCGSCRDFCDGKCCELFETCSNGKCCPGGWFGCQREGCCPNGTKCCLRDGVKYCCDAALGCHCPEDDDYCEQKSCP